jgi:RHS repeat-associated protein
LIHSGCDGDGNLTNSSATKTDGYTYDAFGAPTHSTGSSAQPFQFTGQQTDADSGLQYLRARYYDPGTGRFLGQDPLTGSMRNGQTQNPYPYVVNSPTNWTDPTGMCLGLGSCGPIDDIPNPIEPIKQAINVSVGEAIDVGVFTKESASDRAGGCLGGRTRRALYS